MVEPGQVLDGKYRIVRLIGEGGMGAVFEGENVRISRRVAIKVLHGAALSNAETVQRFEREAQAAGRIGSEHILEILDLGVLADGERYMVMEFLAGEPLSARIRRFGRMTPEQIAPLVRQALVGLGAAHAAGIVHRDLKPDNIFVLNERSGIRDYVKLIDFGISKFNALGGDMSMTRTGAVMGTPFYMSPEQAKGSGQVDARTDLYAMGVILYEAVTGEVPFTANTFNELMFKIVLSDPTPLTQVLPEIDPNFAALVSRAMAREAAQRFASADEMIRAIDELPFRLGATGAGAPAPFQQTRPEQRAALGMTPGQTAPGPATQGSFATSQQGLPPKSNKSALGVAALAGVLVLGAGAFAAVKVFSGKKADTESAPAATATPAATTAAPASAAPPAPSVEVAPAPVAAPVAVSAAASSEVAPKAAPIASATAALAPVPPAPVAKVAHPAPAPAPHHAAPAKPKSGSNASSRDFGY
ncbi:MAG TPA: serine/threonine-protein kinase [Polyangiaceae bacterium]|nr:serine/threonine-protein kinase [Polyangiaceae bacterium]